MGSELSLEYGVEEIWEGEASFAVGIGLVFRGWGVVSEGSLCCFVRCGVWKFFFFCRVIFVNVSLVRVSYVVEFTFRGARGISFIAVRGDRREGGVRVF